MARKTNLEKTQICQEADRNGVVETARKHSISYGTLMRWRQMIGSDGQVLVGADEKTKSIELKKVIKERDTYMQIIAEKELQIKIYQELLKKKKT